MPLVTNATAFVTGSTAASTYGPLTPPDTGADAKVAFTVTISVTSGSPTMTYKIQGTVDGTNYVDVILLPSDNDTAAVSFTKTGLGSWSYFVAQSHTRDFESFQLVTSSVTTTTYSASLSVLR